MEEEQKSEKGLEYEDFEAYLDPEFEPMLFANYLMLAANDSAVRELDAVTPLKKLRFDFEECEAKMSSITSRNVDTLVDGISRLDATKDMLDSKLNPSLDRVNGAYNRILKGLIKPYEDAMKMNNSLTRIHKTLDLLRGAVHFMFLVQQCEELETSMRRDDDDSTIYRNLINLSKVMTQITEFYEEERKIKMEQNRSTSNLLSIKLIRNYEPIHTAKCNSFIAEISESIIEDFGHTKTFSVANYSLQYKIIALCILDRSICLQTLRTSVFDKRVQSLSSQFTKSLHSPRNFGVIVEEVSASSSKFLSTFEAILKSSEHSNYNPSPATTKLLNGITDNEDQDLKCLFWELLSYKIKKSIASIMANRGASAKNLRVYYEGMVRAVKETLGDSIETNVLLDALTLIERTI